MDILEKRAAVLATMRKIRNYIGEINNEFNIIIDSVEILDSDTKGWYHVVFNINGEETYINMSCNSIEYAEGQTMPLSYDIWKQDTELFFLAVINNILGEKKGGYRESKYKKKFDENWPDDFLERCCDAVDFKLKMCEYDIDNRCYDYEIDTNSRQQDYHSLSASINVDEDSIFVSGNKIVNGDSTICNFWAEIIELLIN